MDIQLTLNNFYQLLGRFSTPELQEMVNKYPYLSQAHLLLAKKYQVENSPRFDEQLQLAAFYTQDRELLFTLFTEKAVEVKNEEPIEEVLQVAEANEPENVIAEDVVSVTAPPIEEVTPIAADAPIVETTEHEDEPIVAEGEEEVIETHDAEFSADVAHTFEEWLQVYGKLGASIQQHTVGESGNIEQADEDAEKQDELDRLIMENTPVNYLQDLVEEETHYSRGLDKFIEEQIQKHRQPEAKKPVADNEIDADLVTETMAKVYEMQKKYTKAIQVYETLKIKYPEKQDYYNIRINVVKSLL